MNSALLGVIIKEAKELRLPCFVLFESTRASLLSYPPTGVQKRPH